MNWNRQDIVETYPIVYESLNSQRDIELSKYLLDIRLMIPITGYSSSIMHPANAADAFRAVIKAMTLSNVTVEVMCPLSNMSYDTLSMTIPVYGRDASIPFSVNSYAVIETEESLNATGLSLRVHEDCLYFIQTPPSLYWGNNTPVDALNFKSSTIAPVALKNNKITFESEFSADTPNTKMRRLERYYSSKGLRSINGITGLVNINVQNDIDITASGPDQNQVSTLTIRPVLQGQ